MNATLVEDLSDICTLSSLTRDILSEIIEQFPKIMTFMATDIVSRRKNAIDVCWVVVTLLFNYLTIADTREGLN